MLYTMIWKPTRGFVRSIGRDDMSYKLYLDDIRMPTEPEWKVVRSFNDAISLINGLGCPEFISFDHDLGRDSLTGYDLAKWIVEKDLDNPGFIPKNFEFNVHSANPVGAENIERYLNKYLEFRRG